MLDRLAKKAAAVGGRRVSQVVDALTNIDVPPGVKARPIANGIELSGTGLRARVIRDVRLRSFADMVIGISR
jgi:hypothetical protein